MFHERLESQKASSQKEPLSKAIYFSVFLRAIGTISTYTFDNYVNFVVVAFRDDLFHVSQLNADFGKKIAYIMRNSVSEGFLSGNFVRGFDRARWWGHEQEISGDKLTDIKFQREKGK